jgi:hypothetical protein
MTAINGIRRRHQLLRANRMAVIDATGARREWRGLFLEITVVVVGILIAFMLESWWDRRAGAEQERAFLRALRSDFAENVARLKAAAARQEGIESAGRQLLSLSRSHSPIGTDTVRKLMGRVFNSGRFEPVMGAYEAIVNSGGLAQISDDSLRAMLAAFTSYLRVSYVEQFSNNLYFAFIREYADQIGLSAADDSTADSSGSADGVYMVLLRDRRFQSQVALRVYAERDVGRYYRSLQKQAETILTLLDQQL